MCPTDSSPATATTSAAHARAAAPKRDPAAGAMQPPADVQRRSDSSGEAGNDHTRSSTYRIVRREAFSGTAFLWEVCAPDVAMSAQPDHFVMLRLYEGAERIPLTVADYDRERGTVTVVVQALGKTTREMRDRYAKAIASSRPKSASMRRSWPRSTRAGRQARPTPRRSGELTRGARRRAR